MKLIYKNGSKEIWQVREAYGFDYYVYGISSDPRIVPSIGMARALVA